MKKLILLLFPLLIFSQENNYSMSFDGIDDFIDLGNNIDLTNTDFTISLSFLSNADNLPATYQALLAIYNNSLDTNRMVMYFGNDGLTVITTNDNGSTADYYGSTNTTFFGDSCESNCYNAGEWTHITLVNNLGDWYIYFNGEIGVTENASNDYYNFGNLSSLFSVGPIVIGIGQGGFLNPFEGYMDNIHIWDIALSQEEIQSYIDCSPTGNETGLLGYWNFEEEGATVSDVSGNGNNGAINGQATTSENTPIQNCINNEEESTEASIIGDVNCDGDITIDDLQLLSNIWNNLVDTDTLDFPCTQNYSEITNESIEALQEIVDALSETNNTNSVGGDAGFDIFFPDGYHGDGITLNLQDGEYIVPEDSIFYITNIHATSEQSDITIDDVTMYRGESNINNIPGINLPIIVNSGQTISGFLTRIHGQLFKKNNVLGMTIDLEISQSPEIPLGQKFYITNAYHNNYETDSGGDNHVLKVNDVIIRQGYSNTLYTTNSFVLPVTVNSGDIISGNMNINGYLVDEDYFSLAGSSTNPNTENINDKLLSDIKGGVDVFHNGDFNYWESLSLSSDEAALFVVPEGKYMRIKQVEGEGPLSKKLRRDGILYAEEIDSGTEDQLPLQMLQYMIFQENDSIYITVGYGDNLGYATIIYSLYDISETEIDPIYQVLSYPDSFIIEPGKKLIITDSNGTARLTSDDFDNGNNNLLTISSPTIGMSFGSNIQIGPAENGTFIFHGYLIDE